MPDSAADLFARLVEIVRVLRSPEGCPWDRAQTLTSLKPFVLEEAYEVLEAIDGADQRALGEEIGDLIFEGVLLAQLGAERGEFTVTDALRSIVDKLVRRHPHVFGDAVRASTPEEVLGRWEEAKARERSDAASTKTTLSGIPKTLPGLLRAWEIGTRAAAVGFDWERASDVLGKIEEEVAELRQAVEREPAAGRDEIELEMGDLLFAIANLSRKLGIEPEAALRRANDKFTRRFTALEHRILERGGSLQQTPLDTMEVEWERIKEEEDGGDQ